MTTISAVIITKNEERNIGRCLESLLVTFGPVVDEVIVVDSFSKDQTETICKKYGVYFIQEKWNGYATTKNLANQKATCDYIFSIDADESLSEELSQALLQLKKEGLCGIYSFNRLSNYCGRWIRHLGWYPDRAIRLFPRASGKWVGLVHEYIVFSENFIETILRGDLYHYSYSNFVEHREKADKYSLLKAQKLYTQGKKVHVFWPLLSAIGRFLRMYILKRGFLESYYGLMISFISAQSNYVKYAELRRLKKSKAPLYLENILISRTDSIGDVVLTLPLVGILKENFPHATIYFLGRGYTKDIIEACEHVDRFLDWELWQKKGKRELLFFIKKFSLDLVIHAFPRLSIARIFSQAHVPLRVGTARRYYHWLYCNFRPNFTRRQSELHEAELNTKLILPFIRKQSNFEKKYILKKLPSYYGLSKKNLNTKFPSVYSQIHKEFFYSQSEKGKCFRLALHPLSQGSSVEWPLKNYAKLIEILPQDRFSIFLTGTEEEGRCFRPNLPSQENVHDISGRLSLREFLICLSNMDGLLASSTGPLHLAAALDIHAIGLYSPRRPTHPGRWGPLGKHAHFFVFDPDCPTCRQGKGCPCIEKITPQRISEYLETL